jgi:mannosyltransferase OCH1-like enzyme
MDSMIETSLDELIRPEDEAILTAEQNPGMFVQWALIFAKGHPILRRTIDLVVDNIRVNRYPNNIHKMTGPSVYSQAIQELGVSHEQICRDTDLTFPSYRIYGIDYGRHFSFQSLSAPFLRRKKHWTQEEKERPLLKEPTKEPNNPLIESSIEGVHLYSKSKI